ncbi:lectin family glycoprotein receptor [Schizosaccharomyces octosporus yFS286]|uniref:Lectin family glycoprotein receptor n=1 Tax=Schizosaccharomyces octosporus (strain yFS286) TaxID=483514 RepID=S9Q319_SCHOY|nr:lectin family glycoprotein receptor [Schizosaccharomyces octosporus yFS286]EPX74063.1 lectin family glycoprotein receptor [Schizosaccharomyces octosporus yFS286]
MTTLLLTVFISLASLVLASRPQQQFLDLHSFDHAIPLQWKWLGTVDTDQKTLSLTDKTSQTGEDRYGALWANTPLSEDRWRMQTSYVAHASENDAVKFGLWYTNEPSPEGPICGSSDGWDGLLIQQEVDLTGKLIVRALLNDRSISLSQFSDPDLVAFAKCTFEDMSDKLIVADLAYDEENGLSLLINQQTCFSSKEILLPKGYFLGLSSTTSSAKQNIVLSNINVLSSNHFMTNQPLFKSEKAPVVQTHNEPTRDGDSQIISALQTEVQKLSSEIISLNQRLKDLHVTTAGSLDRLNSLSSSQVSSDRLQELENRLKTVLTTYSSDSESVAARLTKFEKDLASTVAKSSSHLNFTNVLIVVILGVIVSYGVVLVRRERRRHKYL